MWAGKCARLLLLCYELQKLTAKTAVGIPISHSCIGSGVWGCLARWFRLSISPELVVKMASGATSSEVWLGLLRWLTPSVGESSGDLSPSPHGPLHRAAWISSPCGSWFPLARPSKIEKGGRHNTFYDLISEVPLCHFYSVQLGTGSAVFSVRGNQQEPEYQEGAILEAAHQRRRTGKGIGI